MNKGAWTVSVVVPTLGRATLRRALESVLEQAYPPIEIIVVADTVAHLSLPADDRIVVVPVVGPRLGANRCRQVGIEKARGDVIALLDDDDTWRSDKLCRQLDAVDAFDELWVAATRVLACGPGDHRRIWPRRVIEPGQDVADYLFARTEVRSGAALLQSSTLCFPTSIGRAVPWEADGVHDEAGWLMRVQRSISDLQIIQVSDVLGEYHVEAESVSRPLDDRSTEYVTWGLQHLAAKSPRVLGDYLCTSPVSIAVSAMSVRGATTAIWTAVRRGRPGPYALAYAVTSLLRILARRTGHLVGKGDP